MDPRATQIAMEQMKRMSPEQMQQMMRSMPNLSPDMMQQAMSQMKNMKPEDWEAAQRQMNSMDPATLAKQAADASSHLSSQQQYIINGSKMLKNEGNSLHTARRYKEAAEKYERAKSNLQGYQQPEAKDLWRACTTNLASCYLNLQNYTKAEEACNEVLAVESNNLKALYRRGQALMGQHRHKAAVRDLQRAVGLSDSDPAQQEAIKEKLQEAQLHLLDEDGRVEDETEAAAAEEEVEEKDQAVALPNGHSASAVTPSSSNTFPAMDADTMARAMSSVSSMSTEEMELMYRISQISEGGRMDEQAVAKAAQLMRDRPELMKAATAMASRMSPEDLAAAAAARGTHLPPGAAEQLRNITPEQMNALKDISPEQMEAFARMASAAGGTGAGGEGGVPSVDFEELARSMQDMPPEQLDMLAKASGLPSGMLTPEMMRQSAAMMANMTPQQRQAMQKMAMAQGGPGGAGAAIAARPGGLPPGMPMAPGGGMDPASMEAMAENMQKPEVMDAMLDMMQNMDEETLTSMLVSTGMVPSEESARHMASEMKRMPKGQFRMLLKVANGFRAASAVKDKAWQAALRHRYVVLAIAVLLVALLVRVLFF